MLNNKASYTYKTSYIGTFEINHIWSNVMVTLKMREIKNIYNIHQIKPYKNKPILTMSINNFLLYTSVYIIFTCLGGFINI